MRRSLLVALPLMAFVTAEAAVAQLPGAAPPDTVTVSPEEARRARQLELLRRLSRSPGQDTLDLAAMAPDTVGDPAAPGQRGPGGVPLRATPPPGPGLGLTADTLVDRLYALLPGFQAVEYEAADARFDAVTRNLFLVGDSSRKVTLLYDQERITADSFITFNSGDDILDTGGRTEFTPRDGQPVQSRRLLVDTRSQEASAFGAVTQYDDTWFVSGDLPRVRSDMVFASHARFTSCDLDVPHYHFATDRIKIVRGSILVARPVRLYFADVPVLWLPFFAQSLSEGRASGLLTPRFSVNDIVRSSGGYQRHLSNVGFYWAMNDYMDATVAMDWYSGNFTALTASLRYRWLRRFLGGTLNARQFWRDEGGREFSLNGQQSWEISERSNMSAQIAYVTSAEFLRRNTFDPLEATQRITSSGGYTRRFDWGTFNVLGSRSQSLSDDRVDLTFPRATLSLRPVTLFSAPASSARWYNNMTWSAGGNASRRTLSFPLQPEDEPFRFRLANQGTTQLAVNHGLSLGRLSLGQDLRVQQGVMRGVPLDTLPFYPGFDPLGEPDGRRVDVSQTSVDWSTSLSYQQTLIGATTLTPSVSVSSSALRSDTLAAAQTFVSAPTRLFLSAQLRSQIFGFFPGFGAFEAVRHKLSPGFSYTWAPEVEPTALQRRVFGAEQLLPQRAITVNLSQTFEAKRRAEVPDSGAPGLTPGGAFPPEPPDPDLADEPELQVGGDPPSGEPTRRPQGQVVTLFSLSTSAVSYDFVRADSAGTFLEGFTSTRLRNEIGSDYLRGLSLSIEHDLFRDSILSFPEGGGLPQMERSFAPHLSAVNLRFSLNARSPFLRWLSRAPAGDAPAEAPGEEFDPEQDFDFSRGVTDEASILPGRGLPSGRETRPAPREWSASVTYALTRPREVGFFQETSQVLRVSFTTSPTQHWRLAWRTSYDVERGQFSDHIVGLSRDLHRWQANFDFLKTATGNWAFRFEVSLIDNRDLKFDYDQRSLDTSGRLPLPPS